MPKSSSISLGHIAQAALDLLRQHPSGLSMKEMRQMLGVEDSQEHFNRRVREIRKYYALLRTKKHGKDIYILGACKADAAPGMSAISERLRAEIIHAAHGRCQMCGSSVKTDGIKLQVDHKLPQSWGGKTERENLWAICEACNRGKRDFFSSFDDEEMRRVLAHSSVHKRLAHMLRLRMNKPVPAYLLEFAANALDQQEDWHKRLRELRYPVIGLKIDVTKRRGTKRVDSFYILRNWRDLPDSPAQKIREYERTRKRDRSSQK